uniref:Histone-lysine N-methyltransferase Su(Var)3-9 n=1 Tax=Cacopsylla melanoneura TaxID=428564 RepID=A0A8D8RTQ3_9HEMI
MSDDDVILLSSDDSSPVSPAVQTESNDVEILTPLVKQEVSEAKLELKPDKAALEAFLRELSELPGSSQDSDTDNNDEPPSKLSHNEKSPSKSKPISLSQETNANEITPRNSQVQSPISSTFGSKTPEGSVSGEHKESQEIIDFEKVAIKSEFPDNPLCRTPEKTERECPSSPVNTDSERMSISGTSMACLNSPPIYNFERKSQKRVYPMSPIASPRKPMGKSCSQNLMERVEKEKYIAVNSAKSSQSPAQTCDFEVEKILDQIELGPERFLYKVKWVGFDETDCTWEPLENLTNCLQLVHEFKMKLMKIPTNPVERRFQQLRKYMMQHTETDLELFTQRFRSDKGELSIPKIDLNEVYGFIRNFARHPHLIETNKAELNYLREQLLTSLLYEKRLVQIENLKRYEMEINVTTGNAVAPIYVINNVDLEVVPANFTHTNHNIPTEGVVVTEEPIIWCECPDNCKDSSYCCGELNDSIIAYDKQKRLKIGQGTPIYECNKNCKCNSTCRNRVIQLGTQVKLAIYKTYNGCGWGVQTLEAIPKGTYVTEYVGEILTYQAASQRDNQTYLFNLDFFYLQISTDRLRSSSTRVRTATFLTSSIIRVIPTWPYILPISNVSTLTYIVYLCLLSVI